MTQFDISTIIKKFQDMSQNSKICLKVTTNAVTSGICGNFVFLSSWKEYKVTTNTESDGIST